MKNLIEELFEIQAVKKDFELLDAMLTKESERRLTPFRQQMPLEQYEQIRDVVFSISYFSKKSAFEIGFKTAVRLFFECEKE